MHHPKITSLIIAFAVTFSGACLGNPYDKFSKINNNKPTPRVIGGEDAQKGEFPFMASLIQANAPTTGAVQPFCGGSLIGKKYVLTANHCVGGSPSNIDVLIGLHDVKAPGEAKRHKVRAIYGDRATDTALLELVEPVENVSPIKLITRQQAEQLKDGDMMTVIGFGVTIENDERPAAKILQKADVPQFNQAQCNTNYEEYTGHKNPITDAMICAGYAKIKKDSCNGDSGGPLFMKRDGQYYQTGIVSWGARVCASENLPGVYVRVSKMLDWIYKLSSGVTFDSTLNLGYLEMTQDVVHKLNIKNEGSDKFIVNKVEFNELKNLASPQVTDNSCDTTDIEPGKECDIKFKFVTSTAGTASLAMTLHTTHPMLKTANSNVSVEIAEKSDLDLKKLLDIKYPGFIEWYSGGKGKWQPQSSQTYTGDSGIETDSVDDNNAAVLLGVISSDRVTELSFSYLVSSEANKDGLRVSVNQNEELFASGSTQDKFLHVTLPLSKGKDRVLFAYTKDDSGSEGDDKAYLDNVQLTITNKAPTIAIKAPRTVEIGKTAKLDASATKDPDGDTLSYSWKLTSNPGGATLTGNTNNTATLKPGKKAGKVEFELTVTDQYGAKATSQGAVIIQEKRKGGSISLSLILLLALLAMVSCPRRKRA
ncbi:trypsin-like serine protease [Shewanella corallii]|uniref:Trypsin-like serine protease n=1 Tax=Shewanella corallii TaxID=560080 RepID=A0ABT0N6H2_9GAMM|nr:serine protease [Shewanella corallii]MCL2913760.1 trypsin-like serine protease [Shewanella corallii]